MKNQYRSFLEALLVKGQCWTWNMSKDKDGYGVKTVNRKQIRAHRLSYELFIGPIGKGLLVCHECDNPSCVNPNHLFLGTSKDNARDCVNKGRYLVNVTYREKYKLKTHCKHGHEFTIENTAYAKCRNSMQRICRRCRVLFQREKRKRLRELSESTKL